MTLSRDASLLWDAAVALNRAAAAVSPEAALLPPLLFFTDPVRTPEPWRIAARLPRGAGVVFRAFGAPDALETARRLREATVEAGVTLLIGRDAALAGTVGADGVHLPEIMAVEAGAIRAARPDWIVTATLHDGGVALPGAHARVLSPVFPAGGPSGATVALGVERFAHVASAQSRPVYALGGITGANVTRLAGSGACGIAAIGGVLEAFRRRSGPSPTRF